MPRTTAAVLMSVVFVFLAAIFLTLAATVGSPPARKSWLRIGIIFAVGGTSDFSNASWINSSNILDLLVPQ